VLSATGYTLSFVDDINHLNPYAKNNPVYMEDYDNIAVVGGEVFLMPNGEIATVMGHEISHALANHGAERMSMAYGQQLGAVLTMLATSKSKPEDQQKWMAIYGYGSQLGVMLPYSRKHEAEADKMGQIIMAIAGYNPDEAANVWVKMSQMGGQQPPEFLSTHPSNQRRMNNLRKWSPEAKRIAKQYGVIFDN